MFEFRHTLPVLRSFYGNDILDNLKKKFIAMTEKKLRSQGFDSLTLRLLLSFNFIVNQYAFKKLVASKSREPKMTRPKIKSLDTILVDAPCVRF